MWGAFKVRYRSSVRFAHVLMWPQRFLVLLHMDAVPCSRRR